MILLAKYTQGISFKGEFDFEKMEVTETTKEDILTYDLSKELKKFDGKTVSITVREDAPIEPIEED